MNTNRWMWSLPLVISVLVFCVVLIATPPGFDSIRDVIFGSPRGAFAEAAAYALGAAASLALISLLACSALALTFASLARRRR